MMSKFLMGLIVSIISLNPSLSLALATPPRIDQKVECDLLVVGGGLAGSAAAYEGLLAGKTVLFNRNYRLGWGTNFCPGNLRP